MLCVCVCGFQFVCRRSIFLYPTLLLDVCALSPSYCQLLLISAVILVMVAAAVVVVAMISLE